MNNRSSFKPTNNNLKQNINKDTAKNRYTKSNNNTFTITTNLTNNLFNYTNNCEITNITINSNTSINVTNDSFTNNNSNDNIKRRINNNTTQKVLKMEIDEELPSINEQENKLPIPQFINAINHYNNYNITHDNNDTNRTKNDRFMIQKHTENISIDSACGESTNDSDGIVSPNSLYNDYMQDPDEIKRLFAGNDVQMIEKNENHDHNSNDNIKVNINNTTMTTQLTSSYNKLPSITTISEPTIEKPLDDINSSNIHNYLPFKLSNSNDDYNNYNNYNNNISFDNKNISLSFHDNSVLWSRNFDTDNINNENDLFGLNPHSDIVDSPSLFSKNNTINNSNIIDNYDMNNFYDDESTMSFCSMAPMNLDDCLFDISNESNEKTIKTDNKYLNNNNNLHHNNNYSSRDYPASLTSCNNINKNDSIIDNNFHTSFSDDKILSINSQTDMELNNYITISKANINALYSPLDQELDKGSNNIEETNINILKKRKKDKHNTNIYKKAMRKDFDSDNKNNNNKDFDSNNNNLLNNTKPTKNDVHTIIHKCRNNYLDFGLFYADSSHSKLTNKHMILEDLGKHFTTLFCNKNIPLYKIIRVNEHFREDINNNNNIISGTHNNNNNNIKKENFTNDVSMIDKSRKSKNKINVSKYSNNNNNKTYGNTIDKNGPIDTKKTPIVITHDVETLTEPQINVLFEKCCDIWKQDLKDSDYIDLNPKPQFKFSRDKIYRNNYRSKFCNEYIFEQIKRVDDHTIQIMKTIDGNFGQTVRIKDKFTDKKTNIIEFLILFNNYQQLTKVCNMYFFGIVNNNVTDFTKCPYKSYDDYRRKGEEHAYIDCYGNFNSKLMYSNNKVTEQREWNHEIGINKFGEYVSKAYVRFIADLKDEKSLKLIFCYRHKKSDNWRYIYDKLNNSKNDKYCFIIDKQSLNWYPCVSFYEEKVVCKISFPPKHVMKN